MADKNITDPQNDNAKIVYQELCNSYRAIDDFRAKLLGFLPLASGTGIFLLINNLDKRAFAQQYFWVIGIFGFLITLGLFCYELYGIEKCTSLINAGRKLEKKLGIRKGKGQFNSLPPPFLFFINEPLAAGIIYSTVLSAWTFLAFFSPHCQCDAKFKAIVVFSVGFLVSSVGRKINKKIRSKIKQRKKVRRKIPKKKQSPLTN